jgi:hypothetical protein
VGGHQVKGDEMAQFEIGIVNAATGKQIQKTIADTDDALETAKKVSQWFDKRETFFNKPIWRSWELTGIVECRLQPFVNGRSLISDVVAESVIVFLPGKTIGVEHEFYIKRIEA